MRIRRREEDGGLALIYFAQSLLPFTCATNKHRPGNSPKCALFATNPSHQSTAWRVIDSVSFAEKFLSCPGRSHGRDGEAADTEM